VNLKQRYVEWQAEINLLEERALAGTGAGCVNDYRSKYYFRLPKLNTLRAFDQNGWLATGAETGILGLVCFCWIVGHHFRLAWQSVISTDQLGRTADRRAVVANFVGLTAACAASLFSSVQYNGVLIVFVLVLALIARTDHMLRET
jgi:O-antigen ligase